MFLEVKDQKRETRGEDIPICMLLQKAENRGRKRKTIKGKKEGRACELVAKSAGETGAKIRTL